MTEGQDILAKYEKGTYEGEFPTISAEDWELLKESFPKDDVKEMLAELFMQYPIPYADITEEDALLNESKAEVKSVETKKPVTIRPLGQLPTYLINQFLEPIDRNALQKAVNPKANGLMAEAQQLSQNKCCTIQ